MVIDRNGRIAELISPRNCGRKKDTPIAIREPHLLLFQHPRTLPQPPFIDHFDVETPIAPNLETGQLAFLEQAINCRAMHAQIFRELVDSQDFCRRRHLFNPSLTSLSNPRLAIKLSQKASYAIDPPVGLFSSSVRPFKAQNASY